VKNFRQNIFLLIISFIFSQNFSGNIGLMGQFPQGEFKDEGVTTGFGIDINGMYYPVNELAFGLNLGGSRYGYSERQINFNYYTDLVKVTEETSNNIGFGHLFFRIIPFRGNIKPYIEGLFGLKNLDTTTKLYSNSYNCDSDPSYGDYDDCQIAESTNSSDNALSYGVGAGLEIKLFSKVKFTQYKVEVEQSSNGNLSFFMNGRYLWGGEAQYLKKGDIEYSDPEDGPVETTFNWNESKTDLLQLTIGVSFHFK